MKRTHSLFAIGLLAASIGPLAQAQPTSTSSTTSTTSDHPIAVGTSQQTADEANRKAAQEGHAATVVRTGPSAADRLHSATFSVGNKAARAKTKVKSKTAATSDTDASTTTSTNTTAKP